MIADASELPERDYPLTAFRSCTVRFIHRPTMTDALTLRRSLHHIDVGARWALPFQQLQRYDSPGQVDDAGETRRAAEHAALEYLNIAVFAACSNARPLNWKNGGRLADFLTNPRSIAQAKEQTAFTDGFGRPA